MDQVPELARHTMRVMEALMAELRPRLIDAALSGNLGESENLRHADNFLSVHDMWMHEKYRTLMRQHVPSFVYASEEAEPEVVGPDPDPDLVILVDPLDTSELAVRGLLGYTHAMIYSRQLARPVVAVVGDIYHHIRFYVAARADDDQDRAFVVTADGQAHVLRRHGAKPLSESIVTNFLMRPAERFVPLARQARLIEALGQRDADGKSRGRIGVDFGSVGLCHVAAGFTDAVVEFAKGFAIWDLAPGHFILHSAGGTLLDLDGRQLPLDYRLDSLGSIAAAMERRQKFVAARSERLARDVLATLDV